MCSSIFLVSVDVLIGKHEINAFYAVPCLQMTSRFSRNKKLVALTKKQCLTNRFIIDVEIHKVKRTDLMTDIGEVLFCFTEIQHQ